MKTTLQKIINLIDAPHWTSKRREQIRDHTNTALRESTWYYRVTNNQHIRWWRSDWFSDQFDVVIRDEHNARLAHAAMFGITVYEDTSE